MHHRQRGAPATAIGTAADRTRIENIQKLTRAIGDQATYYTRGIAGASCLVADALNPSLQLVSAMPSPKQRQLLLALETGVKLHDALREPGMPSKQTLEEWRDNPEFEQAYSEAAQKGKLSREKKTGKPEPEEQQAAHRPAVLRGLPIVTEENTHPLSKALDEMRSHPEPDPAPAPPKPEQAAQSTRQAEVDVQTKVLHLIRTGTKPTSLLTGMPGFNGTKLAAWRKDPTFLASYEAAKIEGAKARGEVLTAAIEPVTTDDWKGFTQRVEKHLLAKEITAADVLLLREITSLSDAENKLIQLVGRGLTEAPQPEPAPNQSEPEPEKVSDLSDIEVLMAENNSLREQLAGYKEWGDDVKRLTRELDVALFGPDAVEQASLCDLVGPARKLSEELARLRLSPDGDAGDYFVAIINPYGKDQKWLDKKRAMDDAAYLALHHNRPSILVRVVSVTEPAVTVREV